MTQCLPNDLFAHFLMRTVLTLLHHKTNSVNARCDAATTDCHTELSFGSVKWWVAIQIPSFDRSHPVVLYNIHEAFYLVTIQHKYIVNNT
jgi:hypothetical protein